LMNPTDGSLDDLSALQQLAALRSASSAVELEGSSEETEQRILAYALFSIIFDPVGVVEFLDKFQLNKFGRFKLTTYTLPFPVVGDLLMPKITNWTWQ